MSEAPRHILYLIAPGLSGERHRELEEAARHREGGEIELFPLTEENGREALEKIFAADAIAVWGALS